jgi:predicted transcriptional regulator
MEERVLERLGLTKGEIKVYLALNKLGESTIGAIVDESNVSKSKIYDILNKLIEKGLAGYSIKSGTKNFIANDPKMLLDYAKRKEDELKETRDEINSILPSLVSERNTFSQQRFGEMYEGLQGVKAIREELMMTFKPKDTLLVLGAPKIANEKWEGWLLDFHKRRIARKVGMKIIYNHDARSFGEIRTKMNLTEVKYMPNNLSSPNWIDIFPEAVLFVVLADKNPIAFVVRDKSLADNFRAYFELMWKIAKK